MCEHILWRNCFLHGLIMIYTRRYTCMIDDDLVYITIIIPVNIISMCCFGGPNKGYRPSDYSSSIIPHQIHKESQFSRLE